MKKKQKTCHFHFPLDYPTHTAHLPAAVVGNDAAADAADHAANGKDGHCHRPDERHHRLGHELARTRSVHVGDEVLQNLGGERKRRKKKIQKSMK